MLSALRIFLALLLVAAASPSLRAQDPPKPEDVLTSIRAADAAAKKAFPKVRGALREALRAPLSLSLPSSLRRGTIPGTVAVTIRATGAAEVVAYLATIGRQPANVLGTVVEASLSPADVAALSAQPFVLSVEPLQARRPRVLSQGALVHNALNWHSGGYSAAGVKVGIIDDFDGVLSLMGSELPASIVGRCYTSVGVWSNDLAACDRASVHGTAVAESLVDVAPGVQLFITNPISTIDYANAVNWLTAQGVTIINFSGSWTWDGPGDGTSPYADSPLRSADAAVAGGATFVTAAGNEGGASFLRQWQDLDNDTLLEFASNLGTERNAVFLNAGETLIVQLRWEDSWIAASRDLDVRLWDPSASSFIAGSLESQSGAPGDVPFELFLVQAPHAGTYEIVVDKFAGVAPTWVQLQAFTSQQLQYFTGGGIGSPAESANPGLLAVGAAPFYQHTDIEGFSSRGPTPDGRIKPDIVGVDGADTVTYGTGFDAFFGTSQASPHVAGLAALVKGAFPSASPKGVADYLKYYALPRGSVPNPNIWWGYGLAHLPGVCTNAVSPGSASIAAEGGEVQINVATESTCTRTALSLASWLTVTGGANESGTGVVRIQAPPNGGPARIGTVLVAGVAVTVTQAGDAALPPTNFAATAISNLVTFTWTAAPGADAYLLEAGSQRGAAGLASIILGPVTSYQVSAPNGTFYVRLKAFKGTKTSVPSNEVELVVGPQRPGPVGLLTSTVVGDVVTFNWTSPTTGGAPTHYVLEAGSQPGSADIASIPVNGTQFVIGGVPPNTYHVRVRAANGVGLGLPSNDVPVVVAPPAPPHTPTNLTANVIGQAVNISWTPATTGGVPTRYLLLVSSPAGVPITTFSTTQPSLGAPNAPPGIYHVRVVAENSAGASAPSAEIVVVVGS